MTTPTPNPDDFPRGLLAAYVDGELDAEARATVEQWLAEHPEALDELQAQRELSPANAPLWERAEPPEPSEAEWAAVRRGIEDELGAPGRSPHRRWRAAAWAAAGLAAAGVAAAVAWVAFGPAAPPEGGGKPIVVAKAPEVAPHPREVAELAPAPRSVDPLAGFAVLPMATDDDVVLDRVPEFPAGWLPVGRHPLPGLMVLATEEEVLLSEVAPSSAWAAGGGPKMTTAPGDAPMIFAAKLR